MDHGTSELKVHPPILGRNPQKHTAASCTTPIANPYVGNKPLTGLAKMRYAMQLHSLCLRLNYTALDPGAGKKAAALVQAAAW